MGYRWFGAVCFVWSLAACSSSSGDARTHPSGAGSDAGPDGALTALPAGCDTVATSYAGFAAAFFEGQCLSCHSESLTGARRAAAPLGVDFDSEDAIAYYAPRIRLRAVEQRTMPPGSPLPDCQAQQLDRYLATLAPDAACQPACEGRTCGDDGCGGSCGNCAEGEECSSAYVCVAEACSPDCEGIACGDDGCSGTCGECGPGLACAGGNCVCEPQCEGKSCGDDGCGGSCGNCAAAQVCGLEGTCLCVPACDELVCGDDGCSGTCGTCATGSTCVDGRSCECVPDCSGKKCGDDGCGGTCPDACRGALSCRFRSGTCANGSCVPDCAGRECGSDDCGGHCGPLGGACPDGQACGADGRCSCRPDCAGKACGDDGCGGSCGGCAPGLACNAGQCGCTADCSGRECGDDGCGGSCGSCADGLSCSAGHCAALCIPDCTGKTCGQDGCGGSCGTCGASQSCQAGVCVAASVSFGDVFAIFQSKGCSDNGCHTGSRAAENLDLSTVAAAQVALVEVASEQCSQRKRVARGEPAQSYLLNKLTGISMCSGSRMPKGTTPLSSAQLDVVRAWIESL